MGRIADTFEGSVFVPGHGSFRAGDEVPVPVGEHVPVVKPVEKPARRPRKPDSSDDE